MLDECCSKTLVKVAEAAGHTAQRTIEVAALGRRAPDQDIFESARRVGAVFVTVNGGGFVRLAARGRGHAGVILLPSLLRPQLGPLFERVLIAAEPLIAGTPSLFVEIDAAGAITGFQLPAPK